MGYLNGSAKALRFVAPIKSGVRSLLIEPQHRFKLA